MIDPAWIDAICAIHGSGRLLVVAATGGSGALAALVETPGASRTVLEAVVPYSLAALSDWLGGTPDRAASSDAARAMSMRALGRARQLAPETDPRKLVGVGATASLATNRPKRGEHRVHVAWQTAEVTRSHTLPLDKGERSRAEEEQIAASLVLWSMAEACGTPTAWTPPDGAALVTESARAPAAVTELVLGERRVAVLKPRSRSEFFANGETPNLRVVFPGAFNPPHAGHLRMAAEAERRLGALAAWELSMANVDKPPLDYVALDARLQALRQADPLRPTAVTRAATFVEKAALFPGATFVVGADTIVRIAEERYYGGDVRRRDEAVEEIARYDCRFLVFGRQLGEQFQSLHHLTLPPALATRCLAVPAEEFREDISSTEIRRAADAEGSGEP